MIDYFKTLDFSTFIIPVFTFAVGWIAKVIYERYTLKYKLKVEYTFEQKKKLKEEIAKNKTALLNATEELNHRLWNFSQHISTKKYSVSQSEWFTEEQYYLNSFIYRFLKVLDLTIKTEKDTISIDSTTDSKIADENDILFLKYIKTFKDIFTDKDLIRKLPTQGKTTHFYKNNLFGYANYIRSNGVVLSFEEFEAVLKNNYLDLEKVITYFTKIENNNKDCSLNVLKCFHLLAINFLNKYGHDYQVTKDDKIKKITDKYKGEITITSEFEEFIVKSKLEEEMKKILEKIK